ncbi:MAG: spermidine synthase [Flavobacteriales bacterium]
MPRISFYSSVKPPNSKVLMCGLGGGLLVKKMLQQGYQVDVVELDPRMRNIARNYFQLPNTENLNIIIDDARHYINKCKKKYDIVVFDMLVSESQPVHLYTESSFKKVNQLLKKDGLFFNHYQSSLKNKGLKSIQSLGKTMKKAGLEPKLLNTQRKPENKGAERTFAAVRANFSFDSTKIKNLPFNENFPVRENAFIDTISYDKGLLLTDDVPIFEYLHHSTAIYNRQNNRSVTLGNIVSAKMDFY